MKHMIVDFAKLSLLVIRRTFIDWICRKLL